jgi:hypothetical protein
VVAAEDDDGVVVQPAPLEHVEQLTDAVVDVADGAVVGTLGALDLLVAELIVPEVADLEQALAVRVLLLLGDLDLGQVDLDAFVEIPVLLLDGVRIVGVCQGDLFIAAAAVCQPKFTVYDAPRSCSFPFSLLSPHTKRAALCMFCGPIAGGTGYHTII